MLCPRRGHSHDGTATPVALERQMLPAPERLVAHTTRCSSGSPAASRLQFSKATLRLRSHV